MAACAWLGCLDPQRRARWRSRGRRRRSTPCTALRHVTIATIILRAVELWLTWQLRWLVMQEKAEARISHVYNELRESEKELRVLERELQEIDQIERDLQELTHERELLHQVRRLTT